MVVVEGKDDLNDAVEQFFNVLSEPLTACSEFYTYYYLNEIVGIDELEFDLFNVKSELADSFYNYSIYACGRELRNMGNGFVFGDDSLNDIQGAEIEDEVTDYIRREYSKSLSDKMWKLLFTQLPPVRDDRGWNNVLTICSKLEGEFAAFTQGGEFLEMCKLLFSGEFVPPHLRSDANWRHAFGGESWEGVAKMAKGKDEMTKTMYVDLMWSVEHNNRLFIDKVDFSRDEMRKLRRFRNATEDMIPVTNANRGAVYEHWLPWFLDSAREEEMGPLIGYAAFGERSLRRYRAYLPEEMRRWL